MNHSLPNSDEIWTWGFDFSTSKHVDSLPGVVAQPIANEDLYNRVVSFQLFV